MSKTVEEIAGEIVCAALRGSTDSWSTSWSLIKDPDKVQPVIVNLYKAVHAAILECQEGNEGDKMKLP